MSKVQVNEKILLNELEQKKFISLRQAMELLNVSVSTARRLFINMEQRGVCVRGHGCIRILNNDFTSAYVYEVVDSTGSTEKEIIAGKAIELIDDYDVIFLDAGTTLAKFAVKLAEAIQDGRFRNITIFTTSLVNLNILKDFATVTLIGGEYRDNRKDFSGIVTETTIETVCFDKCFIGTDGYRRGAGFLASDPQTARISQLLIAKSNKKYILAVEGKFNRFSGFCFAKDEEIDCVITNRPEACDCAAALL